MLESISYDGTLVSEVAYQSVVLLTILPSAFYAVIREWQKIVGDSTT